MPAIPGRPARRPDPAYNEASGLVDNMEPPTLPLDAAKELR